METTDDQLSLALLVSEPSTLLPTLIRERLPVKLVIADQTCQDLTIAKEAGINSILIQQKDFRPAPKTFAREPFTRRIIETLQSNNIHLVALSDFVTILGEQMFTRDAYQGRVLHAHPSSWPAFPQRSAIRDALASGVKYTGCSINLLTGPVTVGRVLAQEPVPIHEGDTEKILHERIKEVERRIYPAAMRQFLWVMRLALQTESALARITP